MSFPMRPEMETPTTGSRGTFLNGSSNISKLRLTEGTVPSTTEVLGGKTACEIAEHQRIQELTGGVPVRNCPKVANQRDPIGPNRRRLLGDQ